jgi:ATP-dependent DNA helicase RecG
LAHPDIDVLNEESFKFLNAFQGVYNSTEKLKVRGLNSDGIRRVIKTVIDNLKEEHVYENLSLELLEKHDLCSRFVAYQKIHFPANEIELKRAIYRIKFEELFFIQLKLLKSNKLRNTVSKCFVFSKKSSKRNTYRPWKRSTNESFNTRRCGKR